jgi:NDP-sugar pyrophosphorylase family protein
MIMAAGLGRRRRPLTGRVSKPMAVGHGRSLGARVLEPRTMLEPHSISERISA